MDKQYKAMLKLLGMIAGQLVIIAGNIAISNIIKAETGVRRNTMFKDNARIMQHDIDEIDKIIKEANDDQKD